MKNTRNWVVLNSSLFSKVDEKQLAYLFLINMQVMFEFDAEVQFYERMLLKLFANQALPKTLLEDKVRNKLITFDKAYFKKNLIREENKKNKHA